MANREMSAPDLLRSAAKLIERALIQFDMRERNCLECGHREFRNWTHAKAYKHLTDMPRKLVEQAEELDAKGFVSITEGR